LLYDGRRNEFRADGFGVGSPVIGLDLARLVSEVEDYARDLHAGDPIHHGVVDLRA
jgi:hypothetical protein